MSLIDKKISELTSQDLKDLHKTIGTPNMPYLTSRPILDSEGKTTRMELKALADGERPISIFSDQTQDYVRGLLIRNMSVPSLLHAQEESLLNRRPDSKNRIALILGDPGSGKSELAKTIARARDPRGPLVIDCGGRYMSDLLWEQVIDYGQTFKAALAERIKGGTLSETSIKIFDESLPDVLVRDESGKITDIDWDKIGEVKQKGQNEKGEPQYQSTAEASERGLQLVKMIAELEGIPAEATNSVGIKKQRGAIMRAFEDGRELILDEYTKSVQGSDDSLQTVLQFFNGEIDECTVENNMKLSGHPESDDFTFRREDMKIGCYITATGNEDSDGFSTHALSGSANSRFTIFKVKNPTLLDWKHRISQILTGLPLSTMEMLLTDDAQADPEAFGDTMVQLRQLGLSEKDKAKIPPEQLTRLKNWENTLAAVDIIADFYMFFKQIVNPDSDLNNGSAANTADYELVKDDLFLIADAISASFRDECAIDFRKFIQDNIAASKIKPAAVGFQGTGLHMNLNAAANENIAPTLNTVEDISASYGERLVEQFKTRIATIAAGDKLEALNAALTKKAMQCGILPPAAAPAVKEEAKPAKAAKAAAEGTAEVQAAPQHTLDKLLNQPLIANLGSTRNAASFRQVLINHMKATDAGMATRSDDEIVPMEEATAAYEQLEQWSSETAGADPRTARVVLLGSDLSNVFSQASAVDGVGGKDAPAPADLISSADFLESLKIPALAEVNMKAVWRTTISTEGTVTPSEVTTPLVEIAEGTHESGLGLTTVMMRGADDTAVPVHIMVDNERGQKLIVTDKADAVTKKALDREGYTVVSYGEADAEARVADFIRASLDQPSRQSNLSTLEQQLTAAFMLRAGNEAQLQSLKTLMTTPDAPAQAPVYMTNKPI